MVSRLLDYLTQSLHATSDTHIQRLSEVILFVCFLLFFLVEVSRIFFQIVLGGGFFFLNLFCLEKRSHYIVQVGTEFTAILLPQLPPKC